MRVVFITELRTPNYIQKIAVHKNLSPQLPYKIALEFKYILYTISYTICRNLKTNKYINLIIYAYSRFIVSF